jgi:hypothetical protein
MAASAAIGCAILTLVPQPAASGPQLCRQLEAQLVSAGRPAAGGQVRRYDKAIRAQEVELDKTRTQAANAGCGGFLSALRGQCSSLNSTISRMEKNLASLRQQRNGFAGGDPRRERTRILAELDANGCRTTREASLRDVPAVRDSQPKLFDQLYGKTKPQNEPARNGLRGSAAVSGSYRTLCVRTCDGYFFPIAYSTSSQNFDRDAKACEAACPGTEVDLFRHRVPAEEAEQAVSVRTGIAYADLPNAFLYRKADYSRPAACGCNPPKGFSVVAGGGYEPAVSERTVKASAAADAAPDAGLIEQVEPAAAAQAEEAPLADAVSEAPDLFAEAPAVETETVTSSVEDERPAERRVRVVGPTFLPDPEGAIDLRVPARKRAP